MNCLLTLDKSHLLKGIKIPTPLHIQYRGQKLNILVQLEINRISNYLEAIIINGLNNKHQLAFLNDL